MNIHGRMTRRTALRLLRDTSATALTARMLGLATPAQAAAGDPRRLVVFFPQHAILDRNWRQDLPHKASLVDSKLGGVFSVFEREKYKALKSEITIIDGVYNQVGARGGAGDAHDWASYSTLTGISKVDGGASAVNKAGTDVQSIDSFLVKRLGINTAVKRPLFQIVRGQWSHTSIVHKGILSPGADVIPDPVKAYELLFANTAAPTAGAASAAATEQAARLLKVQKTYVERLRGELAAMNGVLDRANRDIVEKHLASMSELEKWFQLTFDEATKGGGAGCRKPERPGAMNFQDMANIGPTSQLYFDVTAAALACDRTRIVTLQYLNNTDNATFLKQLPNAAHRSRALHHHVAHATDMGYGSAAHHQLNLEAYTWFMEMYAELLLKLKGAGLLDSTTVYFNIDMPGGHHSFGPPQPVVIGGGGGRKADGSRVLKSGRYLKYGREPHTKVLLSLVHAMGATQFESFGSVTGKAGEHGLLAELFV